MTGSTLCLPISLHACSKFRTNFTLSIYRGLQHLRLMMEPPPHISSLESFASLHCRTKAAENNLFMSPYVRLESSYNKFHYEGHLCSTSCLEHENYNGTLDCNFRLYSFRTGNWMYELYGMSNMLIILDAHDATATHRTPSSASQDDRLT